MVSVVKMATVLEDIATEEQSSVVRFLWTKGHNVKIFIKNFFLFTVENVCRVKRFTAGWQTFR
jgi:hypothetical protein